MQDLNIKNTVSSPEIITNYKHKTISIKGESYPENPFKFYEPFIAFLTEYVKIEKSLILSIELVYYNSSTTKVIYDIFDMLDEADLETQIQWNYNASNEMSLESGEDYKEDYPNLNIELVKR